MKISLKLLVCAVLLLLTACGKQEQSRETASSSLIKAQELYSAGQFQAARAEVEASIKADFKASQAHFLAGQIAEKLGDLDRALNEFVTADATAPRSEKARAAAAKLLIRARAYNLAEQWIAKCLADLPNDRAMKGYRALLRQRLGDGRNARADAEAILAENTGDVVANAVLAEEALQRRDPANALIRINAGLATDASDGRLLQLKAEASAQQGHLDSALEIYRALISNDPSEVEYRVALAELFARNSRVEQGEQVLRDGVAIAPGDINMRMQLVSYLTRHRDKNAVIRELTSAIAAAPETTVYDVVLSDVYARDNQFVAAAKILNDATARTHSEASRSSAQLALSRLLIAHNDLGSAKSVLEAATKSKPANDEALAVRGQLLLKERNPSGAVDTFLSIARRQAANAELFSLLADAYLQNDQAKEAVAALRRVTSLRPSDLTPILRIVDIQIGLGGLREARRTVDDFLGRNPDSIDGRVLQIRLALRSKDFSTAYSALTQLSKLPEAGQQVIRLDGEIREAQGQYPDAVDLYRRLLIQKVDDRFDVPGAQAFARASIAAGQAGEAITRLERIASNISPTDVAAYDMTLASLYDSIDQADKANALLESAMRATPKDAAPYLQQAARYAQRKQIEQALTSLDRGIEAGAPKEPLLLGRADVQKSNGQIDGMIASYRDVLSSNPESIIGANELANLLADQIPLDKNALRQARDILQVNATFKNQAILDTLAWSAYRLGEFDKARELMNLANPDRLLTPQMRFHLGAILIATGERAKGRGIIKDTLNDVYAGRTEAEKILAD
ncbi:tetratricopeptide repeat protein [Bradyrhizobium sp. LTSP857]|uniref:tetratricopeptide repeat protein n=1 Tax=Bradyrhizobium sp. LTSP857 TaxID=1619231 RepID=UPI0005D29573|nr:tetratricopeptide repeat protein [Bradyrhizobium sp. LTSP857]KJC36487.1 hypothetical protein UP06_32780 [Bradyrhizobium sp. LTSP857]